ncbi:type I glutamate--ammonia ligase [Petrotoga sp. Shatin.DS.tank11.9.2.9.3]|jgi:glutamine synthetase|uniref:type I glutamate--ammonia ligase n=1 Tax=Petrotoga sp. Shatin.DS.tank11.9.2.9.3 TaxID=1469556 RepID=UPI000EF1E7CD|nr:type I glutamate--ammonia ligase [Petrotoga sp. Shatin.DS.tank11.9.2.9.3]RLL83206.1 glutamine synthetase [Petrotoga sp. Shatin.DS.tank11.9.2.9.3]
MTKEELLEQIESQGIKFIRLQITDINGALKNVEIPSTELESSLTNGTMFDGSSIEGLVRINESDMLLKPDLDTFTVLPWTVEREKVGRFICDIYASDGKHFQGDPRYVLKKVMNEMKEYGYTPYAGPEPEFFILPRDEETRQPVLSPLDKGGYFDLLPIDLGERVRKNMVETLQSMGIRVEAAHHEVANSQHEIDFRYDNALRTADNIQTFKLVVRTIALLNGLWATFMPKPFFGMNGSGMHTHLSIFKDGKNIFYDPNGTYQLSNELRWFIGGVFKHIDSITVLANPTINSYKRLVPGYEAPVNIAWSVSNRSALVRIPMSRGEGTRLELRSPDPTANPYLLLASVFSAGLEGIKNKIEPPQPVDGNIYEMDHREKNEKNIRYLPGSLQESLEALKNDELIKDVLGKHIFEKFVELKEKEIEEFRIAVTDWEISRYINQF